MLKEPLYECLKVITAVTRQTAAKAYKLLYVVKTRVSAGPFVTFSTIKSTKEEN